jgi:hypothetical protein
MSVFSRMQTTKELPAKVESAHKRAVEASPEWGDRYSIRYSEILRPAPTRVRDSHQNASCY